MPTSMHHVNISVPEDAAEAEGAWLVDMLGYRRVAGGPEVNALAEQAGRRVWWFEADDGSQVHLSPNAEHTVVPSSHTAIRVDADLDACVARLAERGFECNTVAFDGERHAFVRDPAGNLWELVGP